MVWRKKLLGVKNSLARRIAWPGEWLDLMKLALYIE
jgi:hypothetical protein